jgi:hypothetical protein
LPPLRPWGDAMPAHARFNPPPGWPQLPEGWEPRPEWKPDPAWPPAPEDWQWWIPTQRTSVPMAVAPVGAEARVLGCKIVNLWRGLQEPTTCRLGGRWHMEQTNCRDTRGRFVGEEAEIEVVVGMAVPLHTSASSSSSESPVSL